MTSCAAPFVYLPSDILFIIASFVDSDDQDDHNPDSIKQSFLNLTGVCRHWRSAFLSCPSFWTKIQIPERSVWHLEELLTRSAEYPLKVKAYYTNEYSTCTIAQHFNILSTHLPRVQSLVIHRDRGSEPPDYVSSLINKPVPMLETFRYNYLNESFPIRMSRARGSIPENLFADHAPKLKEFHISHVELWHNLPIFKAVTKLSIKNVGLTHCQLLYILEAASLNLEFLEIFLPGNYIWFFDASDLNDRPAIVLSSLRTLVLEVGTQVLLLILNRTNIPRDIDWKIKFDELISNDSLDLTPFISFLAKVRKGSDLDFSAYCGYLYIKFRQTCSGPYNTILEMVLDPDFNDRQLRRLSPILTSLELSNVLTGALYLRMRRSLWIEDQIFRPLFLLSDQMESLSIFSENSDQLDALIHLLCSRDAQDGITIPCPSLSYLAIGMVRSTIVVSLVQNLGARKEAGHVLEGLRVGYYDNPLWPYTTIEDDLLELAESVTMLR